MKTPEELMLKILHNLSSRFKNNLILKGGILLRLYNSPRATQDIDFILLSEESNKKLKIQLIDSLEADGEMLVEKVDLHSRGIFIDVSDRGTKQRCFVEISILPKTYLPPEAVSTAPMTQKYHLEAHVVTGMSFKEAFAHKIAATLERQTSRDLYDLSQMEPMGLFDIHTLKDRFSKISIHRSKPKAISFHQASDLLQDRIKHLSQKKLEEELYPLLPEQYQPGVLRVIQGSVGKIVQHLRTIM